MFEQFFNRINFSWQNSFDVLFFGLSGMLLRLNHVPTKSHFSTTYDLTAKLPCSSLTFINFVCPWLDFNEEINILFLIFFPADRWQDKSKTAKYISRQVSDPHCTL